MILSVKDNIYISNLQGNRVLCTGLLIFEIRCLLTILTESIIPKCSISFN